MIKQIKIFLSLFILFLLAQIGVGTVFADVGAAPIYSQGGSIQSSSPATKVSMDYEKVILTYGNPQRKYSTFDGKEFEASMPVHVSAVFKMKNNDTREEKMNVYFPSNDSAFIGGWGGDDLTNFKVNGKLLTKQNQTNIPIIINGKEEKILAYQWEETFNPQQITEITIEYDTKSGKDYEVYYLTYVLGTGKGWQGNIRQGEINFILPESLTSYSVLNRAPMVKENKLPFKVSGNTVTVNLSEYEPETDDVIVLGVYEFNKVNQVEQLKKGPETFTNVLKIAGLFRELSYGPHCAFCTGIASENAENYYNLALNKATSKEELNSVLKSFAYGDGDWGNINDLLKMLSLTDCESNAIECKASIYLDRDKLGETPFRLDIDKGEVGKSGFLLKYAGKMQTYEPLITASINKFINGAKDVSTYWKQEYPQTQVNVSPSPTSSIASFPSPFQESTNLPKRQSKNTLPLIISVCTTTTIVLIILLLLIIRKRRLNKVSMLEKQSEILNENTNNGGKKIDENNFSNKEESSIKKI